MTTRFVVLPTLLAAAIALACTQADAQETAPAQSSASHTKSTTRLAAVVVTTGTRALDVTAVDSLSPIDVITPKDIKLTGVTDLASALRILLPAMNLALSRSVWLTFTPASAEPPASMGSSAGV